MYWSKYFYLQTLKDKSILLINFLTGSVDYATLPEAVDIYENYINNSFSFSKAVYNFLLERGYIYKSNEDELIEIKEIENKLGSIKSKTIPTYFINLTNVCNLKCIYCFQDHDGQIITKNTVNKFIEAISDKSFKARPLFILFGGEPLLRGTESIVEYLNRKANEYDYDLAIITNGVQLNKFLPLLEKEVIKYIQITLDGPPNLHNKFRPLKSGKGSFDFITTNISLALQAGYTVFVRTNLSNENIEYLPQLADIYFQYGWPNFTNFKAYVSPIHLPDCGMKVRNIKQREIIKRLLNMVKSNDNMKVFHLHGWYSVESLMNFLREGRLLPPKIQPCSARENHITLFPSGYISRCPLDQISEAYNLMTKENIGLTERLDIRMGCSIRIKSKCKECFLRFVCDYCDISHDFGSNAFCEDQKGTFEEALKIFLPDILKRVVRG